MCFRVCFRVFPWGAVDGWLGLFKHGIGERARETARDDREETRDDMLVHHIPQKMLFIKFPMPIITTAYVFQIIYFFQSPLYRFYTYPRTICNSLSCNLFI